MEQNPNNSQEKDNLKESCEHFDESNDKDMKNIEEKMQKLEIEGRENQKMEGQMEIEKFNEAKKEEDFYVPNWLVEVLEWIKRMEMADSKLSTSCWAFNELCWPKLHGKNVKRHLVNKWMNLIAEDDDGTGNLQAIALCRNQSLPIPSTPPPDYILGFKLINVVFLDDRVLEFIKCIAPKLDDILFVLNQMDFDKWKLSQGDKRTQALQCLLNMLARRIGYLHFDYDSNFKSFNLLFPNFIDQCRCIRISPKFQKPEFDILFKWLTNRREMDENETKQKVLKFLTPDYEFDYFFGRIKEEFSNAIEPLNFFIKFLHDFSLSASAQYALNLENGKTGEVLNSYLNRHGYRIILRCPKGQEERWEKEGNEKMRMFYPFCDGVTSFWLNIRQFGTFTDLAKNEQE